MTPAGNPGQGDVPWRELVRAVRKRIRNQVHRQEDREDLVQEVLLRLLPYAVGHGVLSWPALALKIADRVVVDFRRRQERNELKLVSHLEQLEAPGTTPEPEPAATVPLWAQHLVRRMRLGPTERRVWAAFVAGLRGDALRLAAGTSRRQVRRTLGRIFEELRKHLR